jgi:hypothetical protein
MKFQSVIISKLPDFKQLLSEWLNVQQRYCERVWPENPWVYGERPCVGLLAAAATLVGAVVLEEWRTEKSHEKGESYGRNDLWLRFNSPPNQSDYAIEAKHEWINLDEEWHPGNKLKIQRTLGDAKKDALNAPQYAGQRIGMAFFSLEHHNPRVASETTNRLFEFVEAEIEFDIFASICLSAESFAKAKQDGWNHNHFGMILLAKLVTK